MDENLIARFWKRVDVLPHDRCWLWLGKRNHNGYGVFSMGRRGATMLAHRFSIVLHGGAAIPNGLLVLHRCDTPPCVNPAHLFIGTQLDNAQDMARKGRQRVPAKVTADDVLAIRASERPQSELARQYGVAQSLISMIRNRVVWKHV